MILNRSMIGFLILHETKQRELLEGTFTVRVPYESKQESQLCVAMCDNALMNVLLIVLLIVTLPEYLVLVNMSSSIVQFDIVIVLEEYATKTVFFLLFPRIHESLMNKFAVPTPIDP